MSIKPNGERAACIPRAACHAVRRIAVIRMLPKERSCARAGSATLPSNEKRVSLTFPSCTSPPQPLPTRQKPSPETGSLNGRTSSTRDVSHGWGTEGCGIPAPPRLISREIFSNPIGVERKTLPLKL